MSPPIRDGSGNDIGAIRLGDGSEISEVRTGAGDVLFSAVPNTQITRPTDNDSNSVSSKSGLVINPNVSLNGIKAELSSDLSGVTTAYVEEVATGTTLGTTSISSLSSGDTFRVDGITMDSGTDYMLLVDAGGSSYTQGIHNSSSYPLTGPAFDVTERAFIGSPQGGGAYLNFNNLRNLGF